MEAIHIKERKHRKPENYIERTQQLPPTQSNENYSRFNLRPKSNLTNMVASQIRSRKNSKLRISLKGAVHLEDKLRYSHRHTSLSESKNMTASLSDKTKQVLLGKRSASKHSRKRSKTKLTFVEKRDFSRPNKTRKSSNTSNSRISALKKKRKEMQKKYITNSELFKSADMRSKRDFSESRKLASSSLSRYDTTNLTLSHQGLRSSLGY